MVGEHQGTNEDLRLCPTCRMSISVWATRCRYCGQTVARPRKEEEQFTVRDLGGEAKNTYKVSGSVMEALESFRAEMTDDQEAEKAGAKGKGLFKRRADQQKVTDSRGNIHSDLPELDAEHQLLAETVLDSRPFQSVKKKEESPFKVITRKVFTLAATITILTLLGWGTVIAGAHVKEYLAQKNAAPTSDYRSRAQIMLDEGVSTIDALKEAVAAVQENPSDNNIMILNKVRARLIGEVQGKLDTVPWNSDRQKEAYALAYEAFQFDSDPAIVKLFEEVRADIASFKISLSKTSGNKATFDIRNDYYKDEDTGKRIRQESAGRNEIVGGRFKVLTVRDDYVVLSDTQVKNRKFRCNNQGMAPYNNS